MVKIISSLFLEAQSQRKQPDQFKEILFLFSLPAWYSIEYQGHLFKYTSRNCVRCLSTESRGTEFRQSLLTAKTRKKIVITHNKFLSNLIPHNSSITLYTFIPSTLHPFIPPSLYHFNPPNPPFKYLSNPSTL